MKIENYKNQIEKLKAGEIIDKGFLKKIKLELQGVSDSDIQSFLEELIPFADDIQEIYFFNHDIKSRLNFTKFANIERISISDGKLRLAPIIAGLQKLEVLELFNNGLEEAPDLINLPNLNYIDAHENMISIAPSFNAVPNIRIVNFNTNNMLLPPKFINHYQLEELHFSNNKLILPIDLSNINPHCEVGLFGNSLFVPPPLPNELKNIRKGNDLILNIFLGKNNISILGKIAAQKLATYTQTLQPYPLFENTDLTTATDIKIIDILNDCKKIIQNVARTLIQYNKANKKEINLAEIMYVTSMQFVYLQKILNPQKINIEKNEHLISYIDFENNKDAKHIAMLNSILNDQNESIILDILTPILNDEFPEIIKNSSASNKLMASTSIPTLQATRPNVLANASNNELSASNSLSQKTVAHIFASIYSNNDAMNEDYLTQTIMGNTFSSISSNSIFINESSLTSHTAMENTFSSISSNSISINESSLTSHTAMENTFSNTFSNSNSRNAFEECLNASLETEYGSSITVGPSKITNNEAFIASDNKANYFAVNSSNIPSRSGDITEEISKPILNVYENFQEIKKELNKYIKDKASEEAIAGAAKELASRNQCRL